MAFQGCELIPVHSAGFHVGDRERTCSLTWPMLNILDRWTYQYLTNTLGNHYLLKFLNLARVLILKYHIQNWYLQRSIYVPTCVTNKGIFIYLLLWVGVLWVKMAETDGIKLSATKLCSKNVIVITTYGVLFLTNHFDFWITPPKIYIILI